MRRVREILLTVGAVLGAVCLLLGVVAVTAGVHLLVFRSGSMSPTIDTGDLALTRTVDATELRVDDVVSVIDSSGNRVTHRLVNVAEQGDQRQLTLRGDANEQSDARDLHRHRGAAGDLRRAQGRLRRRLVDRPGRSGAARWLRRVPALGAAAPQGPRRRRRTAARLDAALRAKAPRHATARAPALLAVALGGAIAVLPTHAWAAPWTDPVTVTRHRR